MQLQVQIFYHKWLCVSINTNFLHFPTFTTVASCIAMYIHAYVSLIACTATDGSIVAAGTGFMNDCNRWLVYT